MSAALPFLRSLSISVGMALATSCFGMIAAMASTTGWWLLLAIGLSLLIALAVAHAVGRLARRFPSALGMRTYIKAAFGNTASLFFVCVYVVMIALVAGVESNLYASIVQQVAPGVDARWVIVTVFAAVFALNVFGHEVSRNIQLGLVLLMLAGVLALSGCAMAGANAAAWPNGESLAHLSGVPAAAVTAFFLFVGFEWVTSAQPGSRQAAAQLPRVLLCAVLLLGAVYMSFATAALLHLDASALSATRTPQMMLAALTWGEHGRRVMLLISTAAVLMAFNAGVLGASRMVYSLAREGCLPGVLAKTLNGSGAPAHAIAATVCVSLCCSLVTQVVHASDLLGHVAAVLICICYGGLLAASLVLAGRAGRDCRPAFAVEAGALLAMVLLLAAMLCDPAAWRQSLVAAVACGLSFLYAARAHSRSARGMNARAAHSLPT
ncbi:MAG TPA: APC family permease [Burkholderiaceae bacterium]